MFLYPNISALPLPTTLVNAYQGILPTYIYAFQFGVNTIERGATVFADIRFGILLVFLVVACGVVAYSARIWRIANAEDAARGGGGRRCRRHGRRDRDGLAGDGRLRPTMGGSAPSACVAARGDGGIGAVKWAGSGPAAARRRMTNP